MKFKLTHFLFACLPIMMGSCANIDDDCLDPEIVAKFNQERGVDDGSFVEFIDLGLPSGTKWMKCNVGADSQEDYGILVSWTDAKNYLPKECYMPTINQATELLEFCTWEWTTIHGISGYVGTGPNGNNLFLPASGYAYTTQPINVSLEGNFWIDNQISTFASIITFNNTTKPKIGSYSQTSKVSLRCVKD